MEDKYSELDKLSQLKENGTITNEEFEVEKHKILSGVNRTTRKNGKAKIFFILSIVGLILTIFLAIGFCYYRAKWEDEKYTKNNGAYLNYEDGLISEQEYKNRTRKEQNYKKIYTVSGFGALGTGTLTVIFLATGIVLKKTQ